MRLALAIPSSWTLVDAPQKIWQVDPFVRVQAFGLIALPDHWPDLVAPFVSRELGAGASVRKVQSVAGETALGAPMHLEHVEILDAAAAVVEQRVGVFYLFLEWGAEVLVRAASRTALEARQSELLDVLQSGRPDYGGHIAALEQVFAGMPAAKDAG